MEYCACFIERACMWNLSSTLNWSRLEEKSLAVTVEGLRLPINVAIFFNVQIQVVEIWSPTTKTQLSDHLKNLLLFNNIILDQIGILKNGRQSWKEKQRFSNSIRIKVPWSTAKSCLCMPLKNAYLKAKSHSGPPSHFQTVFSQLSFNCGPSREFFFLPYHPFDWRESFSASRSELEPSRLQVVSGD